MRHFPALDERKNRVSSLIVVRVSPLDRRLGILGVGPLRVRCALGRSGTTSAKREGDGATPIGGMAIISAYLRPGRRGLPPMFADLSTRRTRATDGWCDASSHPAYNRPVRLPIPASAEDMLRADGLYDVVVVLDWNLSCRARGRGSAIFLHVAKPGYKPTEGCIAVSRADMNRLAPYLRKGRRIVVAK